MSWPTKWHEAIEKTVTGLGYDLVDVEQAARGLLRVTIDLMATSTAGAEAAVDSSAEAPAGITVHDCERVTRQLQLALEVEGVDYQRLEVSSPGLDRPLRRESDCVRFAGHEVQMTLKVPFQARKHWRGILQPRDGGWRLELVDGDAARTLDFGFDEVRDLRLVPVVDFRPGGKDKGKKDKKRALPKAAHAGNNGGQDR